MENIVQNNTNYLMSFYQNKDENKYKNFFKQEGDETKINTAESKVKAATEALESAKTELELEYSNKYSKHYTPIKRPNIFTYSSRNGEDYCYNTSGIRVKLDEDNANYNLVSLDTKHSNITIIDGYCYELASIILKTYNYSISSDNERITLKLTDEMLVPFFSNSYYTRNGGYQIDNLPWSVRSVLNKYNSTEFLNNFYGINRKFSLTIEAMKKYQVENAAFEIIIKTAPETLVNYLLEMKNIEKPMPVYKLLGVNQEIYNLIIEKGIEVQYCSLSSYIAKKDIFHKTEMEWIELIEDMAHKEEDLDFFHIDYNLYTYGYRGNFTSCPLMGLLAYNYSKNPNFSDNYSFGKFCDYVIEETINQGFTEVRNFISELEDYLKMCKDQNIVPTLYSSYLTQTHDIAARNHKVFLDIHQEEIFKQRYENYKTIKVGKYQVIAPTKSDDIKHEGDALNHCVASYIKRVLDGTTKIFFLRKDPLVSLITLEVREGKVCQARGMHNRKPDAAENEAIAEFAKKSNLELRY